MRVLHVIHSLDPRGGGPPQVAVRLAAAQAALGHAVRLAALPAFGAEAALRASTRHVPCFERVTLCPLPAARGWEWAGGWRTRAALAPLIAQSEVVHLHGVWDTPLRVAAAECRAQGRPYVVLLHGMLDPWALAQKPLKKRLALFLAYRRLLEGAACLHLGNADEARLIGPLRLAVPQVIIPNGVCLEEFDLRPGQFHARHPELRGQPFVLFLGRLHAKKGLDVLAAAFALVAGARPDLRLVVAGPDGGERVFFEQQVAHLGLTDRVHVLEPLVGPPKFAALADAQCFCLPSRQEGFSVAVLEALAAGLPVVLTRQCHFPEVAAAGAGVVTDLEPGAVAGGLREVLADPQRRQEMGQAGARLVRARYTWPLVAQQTLAAYAAARQPVLVRRAAPPRRLATGLPPLPMYASPLGRVAGACALYLLLAAIAVGVATWLALTAHLAAALTLAAPAALWFGLRFTERQRVLSRLRTWRARRRAALGAAPLRSFPRPRPAPGALMPPSTALAGCLGAALVVAGADLLVPNVNLGILHSLPLLAYLLLARRRVPWGLTLSLVGLTFLTYSLKPVSYAPAPDRWHHFRLVNRSMVAVVLVTLTGMSPWLLALGQRTRPAVGGAARRERARPGLAGMDQALALLAAVALMVAILAVDRWAPDRFNLPILYIVPLAICARGRSWRMLWLLAVVGGLGAFADRLLPSHPEAWAPFLLANRVLAAGVPVTAAAALHIWARRSSALRGP